MNQSTPTFFQNVNMFSALETLCSVCNNIICNCNDSQIDIHQVRKSADSSNHVYNLSQLFAESNPAPVNDMGIEGENTANNCYEAEGRKNQSDDCFNDDIDNSPSIDKSRICDKLVIGCLNTCGLKRRTEYPEFQNLLDQHDILCIAESKLDNDDVISCPGYVFYNRPRSQPYSRKSGGIGFFVRQKISASVEFINSNSDYVSWVQISKKAHKIDKDVLIGAVYVPPQQSKFFNDDEFELFEQEISSSCSKDCYVILTGDFNAQTSDLQDFTSADSFLSEYFQFDDCTIDFFDQKSVLERHNIQVNRASKDKKKNGSGQRLTDICKNNNLFILNGRYGHDRNVGEMTFRNTSVIDYALVSSKTLSILSDFQILEVDRLFSDGHSLLKVDISMTYKKQTNNAERGRSTTYIKPSEFDTFALNVDQGKVNEIALLLDSCNSNSSKETINHVTRQISDVFKGAASQIKAARTKCYKPKASNNRPWFGFKCQAARRKYHLAKRRHNVLKADSTRNDLISASRAYKRTMNIFINKHKFQKQSKLRKMQKHQPKEYWKFLNSLKNKKTSENPSLSEFYDYFKNAYSGDTDNDLDGDGSSNSYQSDPEISNECLNQPFTSDEIKRCINKLKNSKASGDDEILNEYLKITKECMLPIYVSLFNLILDTGHIPDMWLEGKIKPIFKNKGGPLDPNNYRPITLLSCLGKLFTATLNERLSNFLEENNLLKENQAGFRKHYSTVDHIYSLYSLVELLKTENKKLFCCFVDFSKAFDSVWRIGLWKKLLHTSVTGKFLKVLQSLYAEVKSCVTLNGENSPFFTSNRGVRQGDNLSPALFSIFLNDLEDHLTRDENEGLSFEHPNGSTFELIKVFVLLYADDTVILAETAEKLQKSIDSFNRYCALWKLKVNESKTKVVIFGARKTDSFSFNIGDTPLEIVDNYKYLGTYFSKTRSFIKARKHIAEQARKAMHLLQVRIKNLFLPVDLQLKLFDQTILPILTYSCEVFGFENCGLLESIHTQFLKSVIRARKSTPLYMVYGELGRYPIEITVKSRMVNYWSKLISGKPQKLASLLYQRLRTNHIQSKWHTSIRKIFEECGRPDIWINQSAGPQCSSMIKHILQSQFLQTWSAKLDSSSKGLNYRLFKETIQLESYFLKIPPNLYLPLVKLRTGNHRFPCERGRWLGLELNDRKCALCSLHEVGDEFHYVMKCPFFASERRKYIDKYYYTFTNVLKFKELLNCVNEIQLRNLCIFAKMIIMRVQ
ncbi:MAG: reverse transcriptase family protein [Candidatus Thiodiazotropha endolucinida]|nr:reverse transcriptase family protein [Candidatus Thiodiazotropha taylori]MCW4260922.1 reverse transcriptase family protein [Candidatus Thiodiazotropha endolucinida]